MPEEYARREHEPSMPRKRKGDVVDGVLLLDKPAGVSSNRALQQARFLLNAAKGGHGGTLDPLATGLLPLLLGEATKFSADLLDADKVYEAHIQLGVRTATADAEGEVIETRPVAVSREQFAAAAARFVGRIAQVPPMYSALKRDGKPLYQYARAGVDLERAPRAVDVARIDVLAFEGTRAHVVVACGKGTYVRTLAEDIGAALECGAHLAALRRLRVGELSLERAVTLDDLALLPATVRREWLLPVDALLTRVPRVDLDPAQAQAFAHGAALELGGRSAPERESIAAGRRRVYGPNHRLLGVADIDERGVLQPRRLLAQDQSGPAAAV